MEATSSVSDSDWTVALTEAGIDSKSLSEASPRFLPVVGFDRRADWDVARGGESLHVSAAAYRGKPVFFRVAGPWWTPPESNEKRTVVDTNESGSVPGGHGGSDGAGHPGSRCIARAEKRADGSERSQGRAASRPGSRQSRLQVSRVKCTTYPRRGLSTGSSSSASELSCSGPRLPTQHNLQSSHIFGGVGHGCWSLGAVC